MAAEEEFEVSWSQHQYERVLALSSRARTVGAINTFLAELKKIEHKLRTDPTSWGDPQYRLRDAGLTVYRAVLSLIQVFYAVDEALRIVYIQEIIPLRDRALDR